MDTWRKCSSCKNSIALGAKYYVCSVSTCNGLRTGYVFCTVHCFERHLPAARHKDAAAVEMTAPKTPAVGDTSPASHTTVATVLTEARTPARVFASPSTPGQNSNVKTCHSPGLSSANRAPQEVLVIASRLKDYIQARSEFNTSGGVMDVLSDHLRVVCDRAIDNARTDGRKTVMDRDFEFLRKP